MMYNFFDYLVEAAGDPMNGSFGNIKGKLHVKNYILPFLSADQKKSVAKNLALHFKPGEINTEKDGENHNPDSHTHEIVAKTGHKDPLTGEKYETGTKVKIVGLRHTDDNKIIAQTENHGEIPVSKLGKPESLAKASITQEGFDLEALLQKHADPRFKPAGSTGESYDFVAGDPKSKMSVRGKAVKKDESVKPFLRGESKTSKKGTVAMGTITISHNPETGWEFSTGKSKMAPIIENVRHPKTGLSILEHLNKEYPDGRLPKGFTLDALPGTASHYLKTLGANALHLHRYAKDDNGNYTLNHGTTYTVGDENPFKGRIGMSHLSDEDLKNLDGKLVFEQSGVGKIQVKHRPPSTTFNKLADASLNDEETHVDLSKGHHGERFRKSYASVLEELRKKDPKLKNLRFSSDSTHGGVSFYSPEEQKKLNEGLIL
jgi:hypothetical protein